MNEMTMTMICFISEMTHHMNCHFLLKHYHSNAISAVKSHDSLYDDLETLVFVTLNTFLTMQ